MNEIIFVLLLLTYNSFESDRVKVYAVARFETQNECIRARDLMNSGIDKLKSYVCFRVNLDITAEERPFVVDEDDDFE